MSKINPEETKLRIIIKRAVEVMLLVAPQGYTFDSVELLQYEGIGEGFAYSLWVRDAKDEKVLAYQDIISMLICHGKSGSVTEETLKRFEEDIRSGKYARTNVSVKSEA